MSSLGKNIFNIGSDNNTQTSHAPPAMNPQQKEEWAKSLVGRWWEVYWDPNGDEDDLENARDTHEKQQAKPVDTTQLITPLASENLIIEHQRNVYCESLPQSREVKPCVQNVNVLYTSSDLGLSLEQVHIPNTTTIDPTILETINLYRTLQNQTEPLSYVIVKVILSDAPNKHLMQVCDIITGINGNSFYSAEGQQAGAGGDFFNRIVSQLRDSKRPMIVNFDRVVYETDSAFGNQTQVGAGIQMVNTTMPINYRKAVDKELIFPAEEVRDLPNGWTLRRIPRPSTKDQTSDIFYYSPRENYKFYSKPEVSRFLHYLQQANGNEQLAISVFHDQVDLKQQAFDIDDVPLHVLQQNKMRPREPDSDDEKSEDVVDWYDAKVISHSNGEFEIYFLGDETCVTYTMPLTPDVVRPSVRVWAARTRALVDYNLDLTKSDDFEGWLELFKSSLPPSTDLPCDHDAFAKNCNREVNGYKSSDLIIQRKVQEYTRMIVMQLQLSKLLSPTNDEAEEKIDDTSEPGPFINAFDVKGLRYYLTEAQDACEWLLSEDFAWTILSLLSASSTSISQTKLSNESILSLLINGARVLHRLQRANPSQVKSTSRKKRQRIDNDISVDCSFDHMLKSALISHESMTEVMTAVKTQYLNGNQTKCVDTIIYRLIDQTYSKIWKPISDWINTADDILQEQSTNMYSMEAIESHTSLAETSKALCLIDTSLWTVKLQAKLSRLQFFEMETWSAIKACIQLNVLKNTTVTTESVIVYSDCDSCYATLERLKREYSAHPIKNVNPLGKAIVTPEGVHVSSPLTRTVIDNAIAIRRWVFDLIHAKKLRERSSFIEDIIRRFSALPKLPSPPFGDFDGAGDQPSALLAENTRDSITILSANCYSYNHIIGSIGAELRNSMNANDSAAIQEIQITTKAGVKSALIELKKLPILSVVEEKLCLRDELIDWNIKALDAMRNANSSKLPHKQIEDLHNELDDIVHLKSPGRMILCGNLRQSKSVDSEVRLFAIDDEKLICPITGKWVREQRRKASEWKVSCDSIIQTLHSHGFFTNEATVEKSCENVINIESINRIWERHNHSQFASSFSEFEDIAHIRKKILQWSSRFSDILLSETLSFRERCNQLADLEQSRPKGVKIKPTSNTICLWLQVFSWPMSVHEKLNLFTESWKAQSGYDLISNEDRNNRLIDLMKTNLGYLLDEGKCLLFSGNPLPSVCRLRDEVIRNICGSSTTSKQLSIKDLTQSTSQANAALHHIFDVKVDESVRESLTILRVLFWKLMIKSFLAQFDHFESNVSLELAEMVSLNHAKALLSLWPSSPGVQSSIIESNGDETCLEIMIRDAEELQGRASAMLLRVSNLLKNRCFKSMDEMKLNVEGLSSLLSQLKSNPNASLMLQISGIREEISQKVDALTWLLKVMAYPFLFSDDENLQRRSDHRRIELDALIELYSSIPNDAEVAGIVSQVKALTTAAKQWQESAVALLENGNGKIAQLSTIQAIAEASILSMVAFPRENDVHNVLKTALLMKESFEKKLLSDEKPNSCDVHKGKFPDEESLVGENGDFLLFRLTGSLVYIQLKRVLRDMKSVSDQLTVLTSEKAAYFWTVSIYEWIEALNSAVGSDRESQLVINVESAQGLLQQGRNILYGVADEVQDSLALKQISISLKREKISIVVMKGGALTSPGGLLLQWAALLFEGLRADVNRETIWRCSAENLIRSFSHYQAGGQNISFYIQQLNGLIDEAKNMFLRDGKVMGQLIHIVDQVMQSVVLKKRYDDEIAAATKARFELERTKYEGPPLVDERYNLLDCILARVSCVFAGEYVTPSFTTDDEDSLFAGEQSARDKSRHFLQKSLELGFAIFGLENHEDARDYSNVLAWNLEQAIFDSYGSSNNYREKVRSLRFNLQDPKNPMLCARVLAGQLKIDDLIKMSTDELASKELNDYRQQVQQEATKNVVLAGPSADTQSSDSTGTDWAKRVKIESPTIKTKRSHGTEQQETPASPIIQNAPPPPDVHTLHVPPPPSFSSVSLKRDRSHSSSRHSKALSIKSEPVVSSFKTGQDNHDHGHHITSQSGTESFLISITRLKLSFTTKLYIEQSCGYQIDNFLPSYLSEKGRVTLDEFNKYISDKMKGGRWNLVHLKLSYITDESDMTAYKRLYKEYESLDRICMINVSDSTKVFLITPKFLRVCKCMSGVQNLSRSSTYAVVLTKENLSPSIQGG